MTVGRPQVGEDGQDPALAVLGLGQAEFEQQVPDAASTVDSRRPVVAGAALSGRRGLWSPTRANLSCHRRRGEPARHPCG
ncbi:hypothetical protein OHA72_53210 [Dactylosporangium sp. NBC_01737]|uniref:hypothetical protein n=1 Tax=Dactylosporangium sp. NBC_01737 TaxID=2975959 RepID=UPI002E13C776|nr:hypothetical protein OHA72_53210 [Dactylosporangium sp. NBC_01737]